MTLSPSSSSIEEFLENENVRYLVLGTAQLCWDICLALKFPSEVAATSLLCLQKFLVEFRVFELERPLVCGACVLLSWKYWEDFLDIKSVRKLTEISKVLFQLLVSQKPLEKTHVDSTDKPLDILHHGTASDTEKNNRKVESHPKRSYVDLAEQEPSKFKVSKSSDWESSRWEWGKVDGSLNVIDWVLRDEGKELNRVREKLKLYETCLIRCLDFHVGPFELPFPTVQFLCRYIWTLQSNNEHDPVTNDNKLNPGASYAAMHEPSINSSLPEISLMPDFFENSCEKNLSCSLNHSEDSKTENKSLNSVESNADSENFPQITCNLSIETLSRYRSTSISLEQFMYLSHAFALDFYRTPFCLLSKAMCIGVAAVWKASVVLGLEILFNEYDTVVFRRLFPIPPSELQRLIRQFRLTYEWLADFEKSKLELVNETPKNKLP